MLPQLIPVLKRVALKLKTGIVPLMVLIGSIACESGDMGAERLKETIGGLAEDVQYSGNTMQFEYRELELICIFDEHANRMRIMTPIETREKLSEEQLLNALVANFHSVLDVRYALSDEVVWAVYMHPLKELSEKQVADAVLQVYTAAITFGTTYSSGNLVFPGNGNQRKPEVKEEDLLKS